MEVLLHSSTVASSWTTRQIDKAILTTFGKVALLFICFHKQLCGPLANSLFHDRPAALGSNSKLEAAFHKADHSIQNIIQLPGAA